MRQSPKMKPKSPLIEGDGNPSDGQFVDAVDAETYQTDLAQFQEEVEYLHNELERARVGLGDCFFIFL